MLRNECDAQRKEWPRLRMEAVRISLRFRETKDTPLLDMAVETVQMRNKDWSYRVGSQAHFRCSRRPRMRDENARSRRPRRPANGVAVVQLVSEVIVAHPPARPPPEKADGFEYMRAPAAISRDRGVAASLDILDGRVGDAGAVGYRPCIAAFPDFRKAPISHMGGYRSHFRCFVGRLHAIQMLFSRK